jgi:hypothetical protein
VINGIVFVIRNGRRWHDAPPSYDPHKTICNRFVRCTVLVSLSNWLVRAVFRSG